MGLLDRIRDFLSRNEGPIMTVGARILAAICLVICLIQLIRCYNLLK